MSVWNEYWKLDWIKKVRQKLSSRMTEYLGQDVCCSRYKTQEGNSGCNNNLSIRTSWIHSSLLRHFAEVPLFSLLLDRGTNLFRSASPWILEDIYSLRQYHDTCRRSDTLGSPYHSRDPTSCWDSLEDRDKGCFLLFGGTQKIIVE